MNRKATKQFTLENLVDTSKQELINANKQSQHKKIVITEVGIVTKEDELALNVGFRLFPSKVAFSKLWSDLYFDDQKLTSACISIPQSPLATNDFELTPKLDMKGIPAGAHKIKVEMYELWSLGEKLSQTAKEVTVDYVPQTRADRLVKVPIVKSVAGTDLAAVSESEKNIYREIEATEKKELISKRDEY
jgi:hypothetical protein